MRSTTLVILIALLSVTPSANPADPLPKPRVDLHGDPLPEGAVARLGTVRLRQSWTVNQFAFGVDDKTLITMGRDGMWIWDTATGKVLHRLLNEEGRSLNWAILSPDRKLVATTVSSSRDNTGRIRIWEMPNGKHQIDIGSEAYQTVEFSPDSKRVAAWGNAFNDRERENIVDILDVRTGGKVSSFDTGHEGVATIIFSHDGKQIFTGGIDKSIRLWDIEGGQERKRFLGSASVIGHLVLSPDGKWLASIEQREKAPNTFPRVPIRQLSSYSENRMRVWDVATGKSLCEIVAECQDKKPIVNGFTGAIFTQDSQRLLTSGVDRYLRVYDITKGAEVDRIELHCNSGIALAPNGRTLAFACGQVCLFDLQEKKAIHPQFGPTMWVGSVYAAPDGHSVLSICGPDRQVNLWDPVTGKLLGSRRLADDVSWSNLVLAETRSIAVNFDDPGKLIRIYNLESGTRIREFAWPSGIHRPTGVCVSVRDDLLVVGDYEKPIVTVYRMSTGEVIRELDGHNFGTRHIFLSPDGTRLIVCCGDATAIVRDTRTWQELRRIGPFEPPPGPGQLHDCSAALSADGRWLAYASHARMHRAPGAVAVFDLESGNCLFRKQVLKSSVTICFNLDGRALAWAGDYGESSIHVLETLTGAERQKIVSNEGLVVSLCFTVDGKSLVSASNGTTGLVWDTILRNDPTTKDRLSQDNLATLWSTLSSPDAAAAYKSICQLIAAPKESVPFLAEKLKPVTEVDPKRIAELIAALDSEKFTEREKAGEELAKLGEAAEPALKKLLAGQPSAEAKRRAEGLLAKLGGVVTNPEQLRTLRAIEALEHIGTPEARQVLEKLAQGAAGARETEDARRSLARLAKKKKE